MYLYGPVWFTLAVSLCKDTALDDFYNILRFYWTEGAFPVAPSPAAPLAIEDIRPEDVYVAEDDTVTEDAPAGSDTEGCGNGIEVAETQVDALNELLEEFEPSPIDVPSSAESLEKARDLPAAELEKPSLAKLPSAELEKPSPSELPNAELEKPSPSELPNAELEKPSLAKLPAAEVEKPSPVEPPNAQKAKGPEAASSGGVSKPKPVRRQKQHVFEDDCDPTRQQIRLRLASRMEELRPDVSLWLDVFICLYIYIYTHTLYIYAYIYIYMLAAMFFQCSYSVLWALN